MCRMRISKLISDDIMVKIKRVCLYCDKTIVVTPYIVKRGYGKFCSRECAGRYNFEHGTTNLVNYTGNKEGNTNLLKEDKVCIVCNKTYKTRHFNITHQKYCSDNCRYISEARKIRNGEEIVELYNQGYGIFKLGRKFRVNQDAIATLLTQNSVKVRSAGEQRKFLMHHGIGNWRKKVMAPCKVCGKPFYPKLNKRYCSVTCEFKDPDRINEMRMYALKQISEGKMHHSNTVIEKRIAAFLNEQNIPFKHQYQLGYWSFDFFIPGKTLIEVDGDYWHANPEIF